MPDLDDHNETDADEALFPDAEPEEQPVIPKETRLAVLATLTPLEERDIVRAHNEASPRKPWAMGAPRTPVTRRYIVHPDDIPALRVHPAGARVLAALNLDAMGRFTGETRAPEITLLDARPAREGMTGLNATDGRIYQEYNEDIQSLSDRMSVFEEMRRSEPAFAACEWLISIPLAQAPYWFEPGDRKDERCVLFSEFLNWNLTQGLTRPFGETAREAAMGIFYGFTWAYPRYEYKRFNGKVFTGWRQFAPRSRATVYQWRLDDDGGLRGLYQYGTVPSTGEPKMVVYDIEEIIIWTWRGDNGDPEGLGAYRQAYKPYSYLTAFEEFAAIRVERQSCGIPIATGPIGGYDTADGIKVLAIINNIRAGHDAGIVVPEGWTIAMLDVGAADVPFGDHIERQRRNIFKTVGAQFVELSQGDGNGSNALSRDASSTFYEGLNYMADWVCQGVNAYAVPRLMERNPRELTGEKQPRLMHGRVGVRDLERYARAIELPFRDKSQIPQETIAQFAELAGLSPSAVENWLEEQQARQKAEAARQQQQAALQPTDAGAA